MSQKRFYITYGDYSCEGDIVKKCSEGLDVESLNVTEESTIPIRFIPVYSDVSFPSLLVLFQNSTVEPTFRVY